MKKHNPFYVTIKGDIPYKTTFEELSDEGYNHFESAFLVMAHAKRMIYDGRSMICADSPFKPKASALALYELCNSPKLVVDLKKSLIEEALFNSNSNSVSDDLYMNLEKDIDFKEEGESNEDIETIDEKIFDSGDDSEE